MAALPFLTMVPAGAGSGKTHRIKEQLADWVQKGVVQPDRIAAVTFTETAASDLRERIRTTLMERDRMEDALRLDQSFITTIHGFGNRLLVEYAFEAQHAPALRLLGEDEEGLLLRKAISRIERIEKIGRKLELFGYTYDFVSKADGAGKFRDRILECVQMLRVIGGALSRSLRLEHALNLIVKTYGPTDDAKTLTAPLRRSAQRLLKTYPKCMRDFVDSDGAKKAVEADHRHLQEAANTPALNDNWGLWLKLQKLKVFKKDNQLPAEYQELAREVIALASELYRHPGPLADAMLHAQVLLDSAWDTLVDYAQRKRDKGIIDYTDMIDIARQLFDIPEVIQHAAKRFDCLVIDEFQDTNPLQFSMLWKLHQAGVPALVVGDVKQSIMGFQSADSRLMHSLMKQNVEQCQPLDCNWRSQRPLMELVNAVGGEMFNEEYTSLTPRTKFDSKLGALEAICFKGKGIKPAIQTLHVAARIKAILSDKKTIVYDDRTKKHRRVRGEDIAVLGLTHRRLKGYAEALNAIGIRTRLEQDGWFSSRPVQLLYHGLCRVADPGDKHAALYLSVTELGDEDLTSATKTLLKGDQLRFSLLERLDALALNHEISAVDELVAHTIEAMGLYDVVSTWPDSRQARANLLRFQAEAEAFVKADREALAGGGFFGSGLKTFLAWMQRNLEERDGDRQPIPHVHDEDAVQLRTWHAAKGMEWPIVVVTTLDQDVGARLPSMDIEYTEFKDLTSVLDNARIEFSPAFAAPETNERFKERLDGKAQTEGLNLLYVALTRAREQLVLEWPQNLAKSTRYTFWHLLGETARMRLDGNQMVIGKASFGCRVTEADKEPPADFQTPAAPPPQMLPVIGRRAMKASVLPETMTPLFVSPSSLHGAETDRVEVDISTVRYAKPPKLSLVSGAARGLIVHRTLELLGQGVPEDVARGAVGSAIGDADWSILSATSKQFTEALSAQFSPKDLHWEVPIVAKDKSGSVINGTIDLLVETKVGYWIVDHKSDDTDDREARFATYLPQLKCYARAMAEGVGATVIGVAIHWACFGEISYKPFP
jgi:ATP-dependent helicase/nuclease subunit A